MDENDRPRLRPNPTMAQVNGLDAALVADLLDQMAEAFDAELIDHASLKTGVAVLHEALRGGPIMDYFATLKDEMREAIGGLATIDPTNVAEITKVQAAIGRATHLINWMAGYIHSVPNAPPSDSAEIPDDM